MRIELAVKNVKYAMASYTINYILKFVVRVIFIKTLSLEYLGINNVFIDIFLMLTFAELGIGPAMVYSLYLPLASKNIEQIKSIMHLFKITYRFIAGITFLIGIVFVPYLDYFFVKSNPVDNLFLLYFIFLINTSISYLFSYKRSLIIADQKQYVDTLYHSIFQILLSIFQAISLIIFSNYLIYVILMLVFTVCENYIISKKAEKIYPFLLDKNIEVLDKDIKKKLHKNVKAMIGHKICAIVNIGMVNLILARITGLIQVGLYSNYNLVINALDAFMSQIFASIISVIGNYIIVESREKQKKIFNILEFLSAWLSMVLSVVLYSLLEDLITIWIGEKYLLINVITTSIIIKFYIGFMRKAILIFRDACGLYWNDRYKPLAEVIINLIASVYLTIYYGIVGVIWGGIISAIFTWFWIEPYILFQNNIDIKLKNYFKDYFKYTGITLITAVFTKLFYTSLFSKANIINFIFGVILCLVISNVVWIVIFRKREEMAYLRNVARDKFGMKFL